MKKFLAVLLALAMVLCFAACGEKKQDEEPKEEAKIYGVLASATQTEEEWNAKNVNSGDNATYKFFDDMYSMTVALQTGKIDAILCVPEATAKYIEQHNDQLKANVIAGNLASVGTYNMGILKKNQEVYDLVNGALEDLIADGTLEKLAADYISAVLNEGKTLEAVELPKFEGAQTIKVAVTGDLPPIDYTDVNGKPAGFNIALIAEIANRAKVNIEFVSMNSGARTTSLISGKCDVVFWFRSCAYDNAALSDYADCPGDVLLTAPYYTSQEYYLTKK